MNNSESGRKINQAVNTTSRAVGGALVHAKGAISSWWSAITTQPTTYNEDDSINHSHDKQNLDSTRKSVDGNDLDEIENNVISVEGCKEEINFGVQQGHGGIVEIGREANFIDRNVI